MLGWFLRLVGLRPKARDRGTVFRFFDGTRSRGADPLALRLALDAAFPQWAVAADELFKLDRAERAFAEAGMDVGEKLTAETEAKRSRHVRDLVAGTRKAFGVEPYSEDAGRPKGLTDLECLDLLAEYLSWVADLMEDTRPLPLSPPPSGLGATNSVPASGSDLPSTPPAPAASGAN